MKRHRARISGSQTPWEQLCGDGFAATNNGFVLLIDDQQRLLAASPHWHDRFRAWWRWPEGATWSEVTPVAGARSAWRRWQDILSDALAAGTFRRQRVTLRRGNGGRVTLHWVSRPLQDNAGRGIGVVLAGRFGNSRAAAHASRKLTRSVVLNARAVEMISLLVRPKRRAGESGNFVEDLSGATQLPKGASAARIGAAFPGLLPKPWHEACEKELKRMRADGQPGVVEFPVDDPGVGDAAWELAVVPMAGARTNVLLRRDPFAAVARRALLTCGEQVVGLEGELRRAQRLATQGMLAAAIGHEVNNCLGIALANASLFREQHGANSPEAARAIDPVIHAVQVAGRICDRFRHLGGGMHPTLEVIDLAAAVARCFEMLVRIIPRRLTFEPRYSGELLVRGDHTHLEQMVINLVLNARDATREGTGRIVLAVGRTEASETGRARHWFEVTDDGAGIPAAVQAKLFTAFFTTKRNKRGTGLGLATVRRLALAMKGDVQLSSVVGSGTTMRVILPAALP